ncbi:hypothetical protein F5Y10DRAFT_271759 [Nemania abortiva]|nr:hypothetical protein F5Y10DRAFT_271759 [Nemania abortiva]
MANRSTSSGCLSAEPHDDNITNPLLHFHGCIEIWERDAFLKGNVSIWEDEIEHRKKLPKPEDAEIAVDRLKESWKSNFEAEMKRIAVLRLAVSKDGHDKPLVDEVDESREAWRDSLEYQNNIERVKRWRVNAGKKNSVIGPPLPGSRELDDYDPDKDVSVPVIQFENGKGFTDLEDKSLSGKFPNQKTTIDKLLGSEQEHSPLLRTNNERIRYFHIPSNNMIWAEEAIARYYGERRPDFNASKRQLGRAPKTSTYMILQEKYWRGRLHGDSYSLPHARPTYIIALEKTEHAAQQTTDKKMDSERNNVVLFMPYLHWETSGRQEKFAREIDEIVKISAENIAKEEADAKEQRRKERRLLLPSITPSVATQGPPIASTKKWNKLKKSVVDAIWGDDAQSYRNEEAPNFDDKTPLGRYLMAAAQLYESMTTYRDRRLLQKYLPEDPPIHPRRTLDQAYYWTLKSTKKRDKDQVLFRGTTVARDAFHRPDKKEYKCPEHADMRGKDCEVCRNNIRMVSRVVMVDQLWMWVLDAKTLITCFPKRYGANRQDYSGVHKSIRASLEELESNQIRTVFELGLIVLDKCTTTFFSRTKSLDRRPQVIDEFSKAIGNIMHNQTLAFDRLWRWTDNARTIYRSPAHHNTKKRHIPLLDINPEGKLDQEIGDIIEELDIMLRITNIHRDIVKRFVEQAERVLDPNGELRKIFEHNLQKPGDTDTERATKNKYEDYESFKLRANESQDRINRHVKDLESLRQSAKNTADGVLHLLTMKQQQAGVDQAWQAVKQSDETVKQGRSILVFTLATIIFLPLSFLTSVFGMNNYEFGEDKWRLKDQLLYIFLISAGVVLVSLVFAFSSGIRVRIWSFSARAWFKFLTETGIFTYVDERQGIGKILDDTKTKINNMKTEARKRNFEKMKRRREKQEKKEAESGKTAAGAANPTISSGASSGRWPSLSDWIPLRSRKHANGNYVPNGNNHGNGVQGV